ncbi:MAG: DUF202 domain-containing protein [Parachlamydiaceae bacterium]|nr:DUF202 domain-containing protein [Parachlamydiaceae bacterium]
MDSSKNQNGLDEDDLTLSLKDRNELAYERTRLAAERTLLSWIRTGLASIGIGIAVGHFLMFQQLEHQLIANVIGKFLIAWGIITFIFAFFSFRSIHKQLDIKKGYGINLIGITFLIVFLVVTSSLLFWIIK